MRHTKKGTIVTNISIPKDNYERVEKLRTDEKRSFSQMVDILIEEALDARGK